MLVAMRQLNASRPLTTHPTPDVSDRYQLVKQLARQAKRRSKTVFRRVKHTLLTPPSPSTLPVPTRKIQRILQRNSPWCRSAAEHIPWSPTLPDVPCPTVPELRSLARSARKTSPGPDGVPPYLLSILTDPCFPLVHRCLSLCYETGHIPHACLTSETPSIYKGKGLWRDPDRWRPIAMSNSIYRLLMRWTHMRLYPLLSPHMNTRQFGSRCGVSTAHATQAFLNDLDMGTTWEAIYAFDMYHAFDSPPKILISEVLERMGTPLKLLRLIQTVLEHGSTFIGGSPDEVFRTTQGVKQRCPLSCFLFVLVFEIPLRYLQSQGLTVSAYVDDVSTPITQGNGDRTASQVQPGLNLIDCQLNVAKSECLPLLCPPPPNATLAAQVHSPS